jgi:RNA recognition motif-containing protein
VALIKDRDTGRSKGFAFVELSSQTEAEPAIKDLNGKMVGDREIKIDKAKPPKDNYRSY